MCQVLNWILRKPARHFVAYMSQFLPNMLSLYHNSQWFIDWCFAAHEHTIYAIPPEADKMALVVVDGQQETKYNVRSYITNNEYTNATINVFLHATYLLNDNKMNTTMALHRKGWEMRAGIQQSMISIFYKFAAENRYQCMVNYKGQLK